MPKVSVIILAYNQEKTVGRAIESVLAQQTEYDFEIVVADDASTDGTRMVCEKYAREYPDIVRLLPVYPNKGLVDNYFDAIDACEGEYVADCAGDDEWVDVTRIQRSVEILDADDKLALVFTDVEEDRGGERRLHSSDRRRWKWMKRGRINWKDLLLGVMNHTRVLPYTLSAAIIRRRAIDLVYSPSPHWVRKPECGVEDVPLMAALAEAGDAQFLPIVGYRYYIDGESLSNNLDVEKEYRFYARILSCIRELVEYYLPDPDMCRKHFNNKISHIAALARRSGSRELYEDFCRRRKEWPLILPPRAMAHYALMWLHFGKPGKIIANEK